MPRPSELLGIGPQRVTRRSDVFKDHWEVIVLPPAPLRPKIIILTDEELDGYLKWSRGEGLIQNVLPTLNRSAREALMTGMDDEEFKSATTAPVDDLQDCIEALAGMELPPEANSDLHSIIALCRKVIKDDGTRAADELGIGDAGCPMCGAASLENCICDTEDSQ